jgi:hypothetical protein
MRVVVTATSRIPDGDATLYPDALTTLTVRLSSGQGAGTSARAGEVLLALPCLRHHVALPATRLQVGAELLLSAIPWDAVAEEVTRTKRYDDSERYDLPLFFAAEWALAPPAR